MDIKLENVDKVSALLTVNVKADDYNESLEKSLKDYRRKAQMKGFRPGCVPMNIVKKLYGPAAKAEEISKTVSKGIEDYLKENKIGILGHILENKDQKPQDYEKGDEFEFLFDIALAPKFEIALTADDKLPYYDIQITDEFVDERVKEYALSRGKFEQADSYEKGDYMKGDLVELNPAEGEEALKVEEVLISPEYLKDDAQKALFDNAKKGDVITVTPSKMYDGDAQVAAMLKIKTEEVAKHAGEFTYTINEINHRVPAELNQELFDSVLGKDQAKDEKEFREGIRKNFEASNVTNSNYKFLMDLQDYAMEKAGEIEFSEPLLKRLMKENNPDRDDKFIDENYPAAIRQLKWQEIKNQLAVKAGIKVENNDIKEAARRTTREQFAQYGMNLPEDVVEKYAEETLKKGDQIERLVDDVIDNKLIDSYKGIMTLEHKSVTLDEFNKLLDKK
jgi:trigger factor